MIARGITGLLLLLLPMPALAHDYWLEPETYFPVAGKVMILKLHVGDDFVSEMERPFQKKPTVKFDLIGAKKKLDLLPEGEDGKTPVARVTIPTPGTYLMAMERAPQTIRLEAEKFNRYLTEEGLENILAQRKQAGEEKQEGKERYSRYLKCLVQAGDPRDDTFKQVLGLKLEIVPQVHPYSLKPGDSLAVLILFDGKPLKGVRLFAHHRKDGKTETQALTTSDAGLATLKLPQAGPYLVRLVHMRRCTDKGESDWESFWGALTFAVR